VEGVNFVRDMLKIADTGTEAARRIMESIAEDDCMSERREL